MMEYLYLIDVCLGKVVELKISESLIDFDFKLVRDINPKMTDEDILKIANEENRVIITSDKDFGELVYHNKKEHKGVLLLRIDELIIQDRIDVIISIISEYKDKLKNKFCVFQKDRLRIR